MQPRSFNDTLRGRILGELTRIIRRWVMLSVGVALGLSALVRAVVLTAQALLV